MTTATETTLTTVLRDPFGFPLETPEEVQEFYSWMADRQDEQERAARSVDAAEYVAMTDNGDIPF